MATRKCGNIYFPKYFMAVRPFLRPFFLTRIFSKKFWGWRGRKPKISWEKKRFLRGNFPEQFPRPKFPHEKKARILPAEEIFEPKISWSQEETLRGNFGIT